jgi:uncharacterized membrane protein YraQ (UPF0718 family)
LGLLEGLLVNLWRGRSAVGTAARGLVARAYTSVGAALPARAIALRLATALVAIVLVAGAAPAYGSEASKILEKCGHGEPFSGYSQKAYREALKQMTTTGSQYSPCEDEIRKAEEAAAGGGTGATAGTPASNVALPLTPAEQRAVQSAHRSGSAPVQIGSEPVHPGVVHANIASAVNTLPHSLFAVLAFMFVGALVLAIGEVRKRVRSRRDG